MDWYRAYHGMPQDAKLKVVAHRTKQPMASVVAVWVHLLDMASQHNPRGNVVIDAELIAVMQNLETDDVTRIINAFYEKNLLTPENRLTNWDKRQYTTSTDRMKKHRDTKKRGVTRSDADVTPCDTVKREETKKQTDTDYREQIADTEGRNADTRVDAEAEKEQKTNSNTKQKTHTEKREREREKQESGGKLSDQNQSQTESQRESKKENEILQQMLDIWNELVQSKLTRGQKAKLTEQRKELLAKRWIEDFNQDIRAWRYYCEIIASSQFCLGKREGKEGKAWTIDFSWAIASPDNVARIMEGGFSGGSHPPKPPACNVPELQLAWDTVLELFEQKHSKPTCRSWLSNTVITRMQRICDGNVVTLLCPSKFARDWINQHYLADLNRWFAEATKNSSRVTGVELIVEG